MFRLCGGTWIFLSYVNIFFCRTQWSQGSHGSSLVFRHQLASNESRKRKTSICSGSACRLRQRRTWYWTIFNSQRRLAWLIRFLVLQSLQYRLVNGKQNQWVSFREINIGIIASIFTIYEHFWYVFLENQLQKMIFCKRCNWNLCDLHEWFWYVSSDFLLE